MARDSGGQRCSFIIGTWMGGVGERSTAITGAGEQAFLRSNRRKRHRAEEVHREQVRGPEGVREAKRREVWVRVQRTWAALESQMCAKFKPREAAAARLASAGAVVQSLTVGNAVGDGCSLLHLGWTVPFQTRCVAGWEQRRRRSSSVDEDLKTDKTRPSGHLEAQTGEMKASAALETAPAMGCLLSPQPRRVVTSPALPRDSGAHATSSMVSAL